MRYSAMVMRRTDELSLNNLGSEALMMLWD